MWATSRSNPQPDFRIKPGIGRNLGFMKFKALVLALSSLVLLAGCVQIFGTTSAQVSDPKGMDEQMFAQMMVPHHEQAIEMSELAPTRTDTPEVLAIAEKIKAGQEPEILLMEAWLPADHGHGGHDGHTGMDGMLTEDELAALEAASGAEFDKLFLEGMIRHHEGAIDMLSLLDGSEDADAIALAEQIERVQLEEIAQMKALLGNY